MAVIVTWNGEEVARRSERLANLSAFEIGLAVEGQAKLLAPVDTGRLRGSITTASGSGKRTNPSGAGSNSADKIAAPNNPNETFVGTPVTYGPYMEYGTRYTDAQPFLRPALDIVRGKILSIVKNSAKTELGDYLREE